jgi:23S rRNA pseudouridine1911/1915/1917 synthase
VYICRMITETDLEEDWEDPETEPEEASVPVERMRITADRGQELLRIDKFLMNRVEGATRNKIQQAIETGFITVNGQAVKPNYKVRAGDEIVIFDTRRPEYTEIIPEELPLNIVYEDDDLLIINKQAGMVVHPGCGNYTGTLVNGLAWYLRAEEDRQRHQRACGCGQNRTRYGGSERAVQKAYRASQVYGPGLGRF